MLDAFIMSTDFILACAFVEVTKRANKRPLLIKSALYFALPVTFSHPSFLGTELPKAT